MKIRSLRRVTDDVRHNAFTGACWLRGNLCFAPGKHGTNRLAVALDTNGGRAQGTFAPWEPA